MKRKVGILVLAGALAILPSWQAPAQTLQQPAKAGNLDELSEMSQADAPAAPAKPLFSAKPHYKFNRHSKGGAMEYIRTIEVMVVNESGKPHDNVTLEVTMYRQAGPGKAVQCAKTSRPASFVAGSSIYMDLTCKLSSNTYVGDAIRVYSADGKLLCELYFPPTLKDMLKDTAKKP